MSEIETSTGQGAGTTPGAVVRITPAALALVTEIRANEENPDGLALWLEVNGTTNGAYTYDVWFEALAEVGETDTTQLEGDLTIVVVASSVDRVRGATLDVSELGGESGLVILNPNTPPRPSTVAGAARGDLSGPVAQRVLEVLEHEVNPQIAMHGGHADLVSVEGPVAFIEMSGGCQGCGMARATLSQGISVAIVDAVPEITEVVDVTDHLSGSSPYYEPALS